MKEEIYYVDKNDNPTGIVAEKLSAHTSKTKLHAAFSSYVFNNDGKFLVTQRSHSKKVWHGIWTNSCCGHPLPGEKREDAVKRRLYYELGLIAEKVELVVPDYVYKTPPYNGIVEHEYCPIYVVLCNQDPQANPDEVADYKWVDWSWYVSELKKDSNDYSVFAKNVPKDVKLVQNGAPNWSWWCKDQLYHLKDNHKLLEYVKQ